MRKLRFLSACLLWLTAWCVHSTFSTPNLYSQSPAPHSTASVSGTVVDPQGALIPHATITLTSSAGQSLSATADDLGHYAIDGLAPGKYRVEAKADGFRSYRREGVAVAASASLKLALTLEIDVQQQQVEVSGSDLDVSPDKNGGTFVLKGKDLDALSNDKDELQMQLQAIAGSDRESGTQFYVDGFSGGKLPPKSSIREIRINQNPYSAQYDTLGYGRIEIFTKPGTDKLHGDYWMQGNDSVFNSQNPFVTTQPPYYSYFFGGDINGPITKKTSFFTEAYGQNGENDSIVNAIILDSSLNQTALTQAVSSSMRTINLAPRVDLQIGKIQTISIRYQLEQNKLTNSGIGQFNLASQALNSENTEQVLQISDTQAYGAKVVNETRFQYMRDRNNQHALSSDPTLIVTGGFTGGGNSLGMSHDNQDHYEFQDYLQIAAGKHDLNMGGRLRNVRDANNSTANFNGQFTFASLDAYQITERGIRDGLTPAQIRAAGGGATQYSQTTGKSNVVVSLLDVGLFAEDNWKVKPNVTLTYGLRFESQTQIHDHADFGPRTGISWSIPGPKNKPPRAVIRAGAGFFYKRFESTNVLQAERQNGVTESQIIINSPDFFPETCAASPDPCTGAAGTSTASPTIYKINPTLQAPYIFTAGIGADTPIGKHLQLSSNYIYSHGEHLFLTRNINAPLPGTYDPSNPTSGTRPLGTNQNIYEYESEGASARHRLVVNGNFNFKKTGVFGNYQISKIDTNTAGPSTFESNQYDLHQDYGRGSFDIRQRLFLGGWTRLPGRIGFNPFVVYQSSSPFNITVGQDLNGDSIFNDRPAFATDLSRPSVYRTKWGNFDASPIAGQKIIPIDYGKGPGLFILNLNLNRSFSFGPKLPDETPAPPADKDATAKDAKAATPPAKPAKPVKKEIERRYNLGFGVSSNNVLNHVNYGPPVGVLGSPIFGTSTSTTSIFGTGTANRTVNFETYFRF